MTAGNGVIGDLTSLKAWHAVDYVSDKEMHHNNLIYDIQGNCNPFIDNPQFANTIFARQGNIWEEDTSELWKK